MLNLTCEVVRKLLRPYGWSFVLRPVVANGLGGNGFDLNRLNVQFYDAQAGKEALLNERLANETFKAGGYQLVLGSMGSLFVNVHLGPQSLPIGSELDRLLETDLLFMQFEVGTELRGKDSYEFAEWLGGEMPRTDQALFSEVLPSFGVVKMSV